MGEINMKLTPKVVFSDVEIIIVCPGAWSISVHLRDPNTRPACKDHLDVKYLGLHRSLVSCRSAQERDPHDDLRGKT